MKLTKEQLKEMIETAVLKEEWDAWDGENFVDYNPVAEAKEHFYVALGKIQDGLTEMEEALHLVSNLQGINLVEDKLRTAFAAYNDLGATCDKVVRDRKTLVKPGKKQPAKNSRVGKRRDR